MVQMQLQLTQTQQAIIDRQAQHGVIILLWQARVTKGSNSEL